MSLLKKFDFFQDLSSSELKVLEEQIYVKQVKPKTILFFEGDYADAVYFIKKGAIRIFRTTGDGREITLALLFEEDFFGETGVVTDGYRSATAETLEFCELLVLSKEKFINILKQHGEITYKLFKQVSRRLVETNERLESMVSMDIQSRVLEILRRYQQVRLTHQQIANMVGASRESVSRALYKLQDEGKIEFRNKMFIVRR